MRLVLPFFLCLCLLLACTKKQETVFSISGRLLESSSNPVPLKGYKLSIYQKGSGPGFGIPSSFSSAYDSAITDATGNFMFRFRPGNAQIFGIPTYNGSALSLSGDNNSPVINLYWNNLPSKDTSLMNIFEYKLITKAIIKIQTATQILPSDTITIQASTKAGFYTKSIKGLSIPANTETTVDTITNVVCTFYEVGLKQYASAIAIGKNNRGNVFYYPPLYLPPLDEQQRDFKFYLQ